MANIAIFGGTFNPFHIGHYEILKSICDLDFIDKVLVMPDKIPPHKRFDDVVDDIYAYFREDAESDSLADAMAELGSDYDEVEVRLVRIKFLCEVAN